MLSPQKSELVSPNGCHNLMQIYKNTLANVNLMLISLIL